MEPNQTRPSLDINDKLMGRYRLTEQLTVSIPNCLRYRATDQILSRQADVYVIWGPHAEDAIDAARRAALIEDPRLVRVIDAGTYAGTSFILTAPVDGVALADLGPLPAAQARAIAGEVASALQVAAAREVYHQALSPDLIALGQGSSVSVLGLAWAAALRGIPVLGAESAGQADAGGLVAVLYSALTARWPGQIPSRVPGPPVWDGAAVAPIELVSGVPGDLNTLCSVVLSGRSLGPQDAAEVVADLGVWSAVNLSLPRGMGPSLTLGPLAQADGVEPVVVEVPAEPVVAPAPPSDLAATAGPPADQAPPPPVPPEAPAPPVQDPTIVLPPAVPEPVSPEAPPAPDPVPAEDPWSALSLAADELASQEPPEEAELTSDIARIEALLAESRALAAEVEAELQDEPAAAMPPTPAAPDQPAPVAFEPPAAEPPAFEPSTAEPLAFEPPAAEPLAFEPPAAAPPLETEPAPAPSPEAVTDWSQLALDALDQPTDLIDPVVAEATDLLPPVTLADEEPAYVDADPVEPLLGPAEFVNVATPGPLAVPAALAPPVEAAQVTPPAEPPPAEPPPIEVPDQPAPSAADPTANLVAEAPAPLPVSPPSPGPDQPQALPVVPADALLLPPDQAQPAPTPDPALAPPSAAPDQANEAAGNFNHLLQGPVPTPIKAPRRWRTVLIFTLAVIVALVLGLFILNQAGVIQFTMAAPGLAPVAYLATIVAPPGG